MFSIPTSLFFSLPSTHTNTGTSNSPFLFLSVQPYIFSCLVFQLYSLTFSLPRTPDSDSTHPTHELELEQPSQSCRPSSFCCFFLKQLNFCIVVRFVKVFCPSHVKIPSRVLKRSKFSASFPCLSFSYPLSKCKCNEWVLHLSNVAMHVDTCLPEPFLHRLLPLAMFAEVTGTLFPVCLTVLQSSHFCYQNIYLYFILVSEHCCVSTPSTVVEMHIHQLRPAPEKHNMFTINLPS